MKRQYTILAGTFLFSTIGLCNLHGATPENDPTLTSIQTEIDRNMKGLKTGNMAAPCFIDFRLNDLNTINIKAVRGELVNSNTSTYRNGIPTVLVGDYKNTNQNAITNYRQLYNYGGNSTGVVFGTDDAVIRTCIWKVLDEKYKTAAEQYGNKQGLLKQIEIPEEERNIPDFQQMQKTEVILPAEPLKWDKKALEEYVKKGSEVFKAYKELNDSHVRIYAGSADVRYYNSEGTTCRYPDNLVALFIYTRAQSADGQEMSQTKCLPYASLEDIPDQATLQTLCKKEATLMQQKLAASMIKESYVGPVLFEGEAVADLIDKYMIDASNGILTKRKPVATTEMNRYYSSNPALNGNELEPMINKKVISRDLTLTSLSGTPEYKNQKLFGHYKVDAQGVSPDKELVLIQDGVLKNMLSTRSCTRFFKESNGHARAAIDGSDVILLPGVLRLSSKSVESSSDMKKKLIEAAKEEDYDYAYIVRKINGDTPAELYRINVKDGSEQLVRGAVIKDMALRAFKRVSGVSDQEVLYNRLRNDVKSTYIVPSAILFDEVDIVKDTKLVLKKNYVAEKP